MEIIPQAVNGKEIFPIDRLESGLRTVIEDTQMPRREKMRGILKAVHSSKNLFSYDAEKGIKDTLIAINEILISLDEDEGISNEQREQLESQLENQATLITDEYNIRKAVQLALRPQQK